MAEPEAETPEEAAAPPDAAPPGPKQFPCRSCGAKVEYSPGTPSLKCPYCGVENVIPQSEADIVELDFAAHLEKAAEEQSTVEQLTVKCNGCGAQSTLEPNVTSASCPFCAAPVVAQGVSRKAIRPASILPFKFTRPQAQDAFRRWVAGLWFAPNDLKRYAQTDTKLAGLYVPYWTYDTDTTTFYRGERGDDYYVTVGTGKNRRTERRTRWRPVSGTVWNRFDDVLVIASNSLPRKHAEALEPWDLKNLVPYADEYLAGFRAESYQIGLAQGFARAKEIMDPKIRQAVCSDIGGDHQRIHAMKTQYGNISFKHLLLPVYLSAYRYRDQVYRFLVNARTGEVQGERPWSWVKILLFVLGILAGVAALVLLFAASPG
jgi:DNA-directed RNA polymerase subunit RPC12/RpoP